MEIKDYITGKVRYDKNGTYLWIEQPDGGIQMLGEIRGWGRIQNMFPMTNEGHILAAEFQDEVGGFVAEAINEKMENKNKPCQHPFAKVISAGTSHHCTECGKDVK